MICFPICTLAGEPSRPRDACSLHIQSHLMKKGIQPHTLEKRSSDQSEKAQGTDTFPSPCRSQSSPLQRHIFGLTMNISSFLWHVSGREWAYAIPQAQAQSCLSSSKETTTLPHQIYTSQPIGTKSGKLPGNITFACAYVIWPRQRANLMFTTFPS